MSNNRALTRAVAFSVFTIVFPAGVLAACGKTGEATSPVTSREPSQAEESVAAGRTIIKVDGLRVASHGEVSLVGSKEAETEIRVDNYYFSPTIVKAAPGQQVVLGLHNESGTLHNFSLPEQKLNKDLEPGAESETLVTMPASGTLVFFCKYHAEKFSMRGVLEAA